MKVFILVAVLSVVAADDFPSYRKGINNAASGLHRRPSSSYGAPRVNSASYSGSVRTRPVTGYELSHQGYDSAPKPYQFDYSVNDPYSGAVFSQNEESDGKTTRGYYSVNLSDGRIQHVKYTADDYTGYDADVSYTGKAQHPAGSGGYSNGDSSYNPGRGYQRDYSYQSYDDDNTYRRH